MKILSRSSMLAAALVVASAGLVFAEERVEVKVPFSFEVMGQALPAGQYEVRVDEQGIVSIHGEENHSAAMVMSIPADGRDPLGATPALVFTRYENTYRLSTVWDGLGEGQSLLGAHSARRRDRAAADASVFVLSANAR